MAPDIGPLLADLARALVGPDAEVEVEQTGEGEFHIRPGAGHAGALIGRAGQTANAIRALLAAAGARHRKTYRLEIEA